MLMLASYEYAQLFGFCRPRRVCYSGHYHRNIQVLEFELVCDDPSADDASTTFSSLFRRRRLRKRWEILEMASLDVEVMKWEWVVCGEERGRENCGMANEVCMDKGMCKNQTCWSPGSPRSAKMKAKEEWATGSWMNFRIACQRVFSTNACTVSCWIT